MRTPLSHLHWSASDLDDVSAAALDPSPDSREQRVPLSTAASLRIARALELRRSAGAAAELPGHWLLDSPGLESVLEMARKLARAPGAPILIEGERGNGVPELARMVHDADPIARTKRFRIIAAHLVGSSEMRGWPLSGTLFVEDLENLLSSGQTWLGDLLAGRTESPHPLRIIGGSRRSARDLRQQVTLSEELVHALDVGRLVIPPLRDRAGDILMLARRFLRHCADRQARPYLRFSEAAESKLLLHGYPANVRELRNVVERAAALVSGDEIGEEAIVMFDEHRAGSAGTTRCGTTHLRANLCRPQPARDGQATGSFPTLAEIERDYLVLLIREFKGRRVAISRAMGVSYQTVLKKITNYGLDVRGIVAAATPPRLAD